MSRKTRRRDVLFQSEHHPLVTPEPRSPEQRVQTLMHTKAYVTAEAEARGLDVLDVGCNTGYGTRILARSARQVWGVDVSERALLVAREQATASNVRYERVDGASLRFDAASFDLVTSFQVIEHVDDVERYLSEIRRVLKPGGRAIFTTPNGALRLVPGRPPWNIFHLREYAAAELEAVLGRHFAEVRVLGLFGEDSLQATELRRIARAQRVARSRPLFALKRFLLTRLDPGSLRFLEALTAARRRAGPEQGGRPEWSLDSLHYREAPLEGALDFMAKCRKAA